MKNPTGYIIYKGPSLLNGKPIVAIAITKESRNSKTGNMIQTYILPDNGLMPLQNVYGLTDDSVCGNCIHRRGTGGGCYVNVGKGVTNVYKKFKRGGYPYNLNEAAIKSTGKVVRLGSYGDPVAVPRYVWDNLLQFSAGHTGYTHQWKNNKSEIMDLVMASADSESDFREAHKKGYRTFRVRLESDPLLKGEFICPASNEGNKRKHCVECKACNGGVNTNKGNPVIISHGILKNRFNKSNGLTGLIADMKPLGFLTKLFN